MKAALDEDFTPNETTPTAQAAENFMKFARGDGTTAMIGSVALGVVVPNLRDAQAMVTGQRRMMLEGITGIAPAAGTTAPANPVTFSILDGRFVIRGHAVGGEEAACGTIGDGNSNRF